MSIVDVTGADKEAFHYFIYCCCPDTKHTITNYMTKIVHL